jgi:ABC-type antimicrobial peptide transport system permease subunit
LIAGAAGFALGLSLVGLYVVLAAIVAQRKRELAVRIAVGASAKDIVSLVAREAGVLTVYGLAAGLLLSGAAARGLQNQLYGVGSTDPLSYLAAVLAFGAIALAAAVIPARRAARVDPVVTLRSE